MYFLRYLLTFSVILLATCILPISSDKPQEPDQQQCSKDDINCKSEQPTVSVKFDEEAYNNYEHADITSREDFLIHKELDEIEEVRKVSADEAREMLEKILINHPNSPRALNSLIKTYRVLYNQLSMENKKIGRIEYLEKMLATVIRFVQLDRTLVPLSLWTQVIDYGMANSVAMGERAFTLRILEQVVAKLDGLEEEDREFYIQSYIDELLYNGHYEKCRQTIIDNSVPEVLPGIAFRFLMGVLIRMEDKLRGQPFPTWDDAMMDQIMPQNQQETDELFEYTEDLAKELRKMENIDVLNTIYDLMVDLGLYPSRYQRINHKMANLLPQPIWTVEDTGYHEKLMELEANWETIRDEALELIRLTPEQNVTYGFDAVANIKSNWKHYYIHGLDQESFPDRVCDITPTLCDLLKNYPPITMCPLGSIKISYIAPDTHIGPHTSKLNFRLRGQLPLVVPPLNETETSDMAKMTMNGGQINVKWEAGKMVVFDDSFEHEVINETGSPRVLLIFDMVHPDMTEPMFRELQEFEKNLKSQQQAMMAEAAQMQSG